MKSDKEIEKLTRLIETCKLHQTLLTTAFQAIQSLVPLNRQKFMEMDDTQRAFIDQYIFRFAKLQDTVGDKLFKQTLSVVGENPEKMSFMDVFHKLEKLDIISDLIKWKELREVRNDAAHDYPLLMQEAIDSINSIIMKKEDLESYFFSVLDYLKSKNILLP